MAAASGLALRLRALGGVSHDVVTEPEEKVKKNWEKVKKREKIRERERLQISQK